MYALCDYLLKQPEWRFHAFIWVLAQRVEYTGVINRLGLEREHYPGKFITINYIKMMGVKSECSIFDKERKRKKTSKPASLDLLLLLLKLKAKCFKWQNQLS